MSALSIVFGDIAHLARQKYLICERDEDAAYRDDGIVEAVVTGHAGLFFLYDLEFTLRRSMAAESQNSTNRQKFAAAVQMVEDARLRGKDKVVLNSIQPLEEQLTAA